MIFEDVALNECKERAAREDFAAVLPGGDDASGLPLVEIFEYVCDGFWGSACDGPGPKRLTYSSSDAEKVFTGCCAIVVFFLGAGGPNRLYASSSDDITTEHGINTASVTYQLSVTKLQYPTSFVREECTRKWSAIFIVHNNKTAFILVK